MHFLHRQIQTVLKTSTILQLHHYVTNTVLQMVRFTKIISSPWIVSRQHCSTFETDPSSLAIFAVRCSAFLQPQSSNQLLQLIPAVTTQQLQCVCEAATSLQQLQHVASIAMHPLQCDTAAAALLQLLHVITAVKMQSVAVRF